MTNADYPAFVGIREFCRLSGVSQFAVRLRVREKTLPFIRSGKSYLVNVSAALELLDQESRGGNSHDVPVRKA